MKVLLVSHTVLSKTGNMGKTLRGYLADFAPEDIAQFYIPRSRRMIPAARIIIASPMWTR